MVKWVRCGLVLMLCAGAAGAQERSARNEPAQLVDDPTRIVTKVGLRYSDDWSVSGSVAFGPVTKINASYSETGEWSLGGSYLFDFGIVNVAASHRELDNGTDQTQYSIGTYVPLAAFGVDTGDWQLFPMAGLNYIEGTSVDLDVPIDDTVAISTASQGGYLGVFALRPISERWTFLGVLVGSAGSDDFSGYTVGGGVSYLITKRDSISVFGSYIDNSFGTRDAVGISYSREF